MPAEAGSIRSGPLLAAAPGPAATASGSARFGERQARLGLHQIDELAYAEVFLQFRVLSITNFPSVIRIKQLADALTSVVIELKQENRSRRVGVQPRFILSNDLSQNVRFCYRGRIAHGRIISRSRPIFTSRSASFFFSGRSFRGVHQAFEGWDVVGHPSTIFASRTDP